MRACGFGGGCRTGFVGGTGGGDVGGEGGGVEALLVAHAEAEEVEAVAAADQVGFARHVPLG